jgi:hypothetical protein
VGREGYIQDSRLRPVRGPSSSGLDTGQEWRPHHGVASSGVATVATVATVAWRRLEWRRVEFCRILTWPDYDRRGTLAALGALDAGDVADGGPVRFRASCLSSHTVKSSPRRGGAHPPHDPSSRIHHAHAHAHTHSQLTHTHTHTHTHYTHTHPHTHSDSHSHSHSRDRGP